MDLHAILAEWYEAAVRFVPNLFLILIILLITRAVSRRMHRFVQRFLDRAHAPHEISDLFGRVAYVAVLLLGALLVLGQLGLSSAVLSFVAGLGVTGIVIGFALQDIVKQFAAGVLLLMLRPFRLGDQVQIGTFVGHVTEVQLRATVLRTLDGIEVLIPNADVYNSAIINMSRYNLHRHSIRLPLPLDVDVARARAQLRQLIGAVPGVVAEPPPEVLASSVDDKAVTLELRYWVDQQHSDSDNVTTAVVEALRQARASLPEGAKP